MSLFLFSPTWSAYGWAAQLIATIFVKYMKSNILSISVGGIKLAKHSIWHYPDTSQWSHQANETAFVISRTVIENCYFFLPRKTWNFHFNIFHNSHKMETTQMLYSYNGVLFNHKNNEIWCILWDIDELQNQWKKPD